MNRKSPFGTVVLTHLLLFLYACRENPEPAGEPEADRSTYQVMSVPDYTGEISMNKTEGKGYLLDRNGNRVAVTVRRTGSGFRAVDAFGRVIDLVDVSVRPPVTGPGSRQR